MVASAETASAVVVSAVVAPAETASAVVVSAVVAPAETASAVVVSAVVAPAETASAVVAPVISPALQAAVFRKNNTTSYHLPKLFRNMDKFSQYFLLTPFFLCA
ncbi:MAG: hypothetical protein ACI39R_05050 [Lachnospiraceae bacterium]